MVGPDSTGQSGHGPSMQTCKSKGRMALTLTGTLQIVLGFVRSARAWRSMKRPRMCTARERACTPCLMRRINKLIEIPWEGPIALQQSGAFEKSLVRRGDLVHVLYFSSGLATAFTGHWAGFLLVCKKAGERATNLRRNLAVSPQADWVFSIYWMLRFKKGQSCDRWGRFKFKTHMNILDSILLLDELLKILMFHPQMSLGKAHSFSGFGPLIVKV